VDTLALLAGLGGARQGLVWGWPAATRSFEARHPPRVTLYMTAGTLAIGFGVMLVADFTTLFGLVQVYW